MGHDFIDQFRHQIPNFACSGWVHGICQDDDGDVLGLVSPCEASRVTIQTEVLFRCNLGSDRWVSVWVWIRVENVSS